MTNDRPSESGGPNSMSEVELRYEILRLLRLHGEMDGRTLPTLKQLAAATRKRETEIRRICTVMQALDYIRGHHSSGGDKNPSYEITVEGLVMLHKREHVFKQSFFDEAMDAVPDGRPEADLAAEDDSSENRAPGRSRRQ